MDKLIKITGGSPANGKILTSDAAGLATWKSNLGVPIGVIVMWSGSIGSIPSGWALCDGNNGTPDLRGRFIVGYHSGDSDYNAIGKTGGEKRHTLTIAEMPAHTHDSKYNAWGPGERGDSEDTAYWNVTWTATTSVGGNQPHENRPPYYALAYIMKL